MQQPPPVWYLDEPDIQALTEGQEDGDEPYSRGIDVKDHAFLYFYGRKVPDSHSFLQITLNCPPPFLKKRTVFHLRVNVRRDNLL